MSIKNRIKKIETGLNSDSEFCRCERDIVIKVVPREKREEPMPETCDDCGKTIDRRRFNFNFTGNVETKVIRPSYRVIEPGDAPLEENQYEH